MKGIDRSIRAARVSTHISWMAAAIAFTGAAAPVHAQDAPALQFSVGAKAWVTEWTSWNPVLPQPQTSTLRLIEPISSGTHVVAIPQASVRYGHWLASAGYLVDTNYSLGGNVNPSDTQASQFAAKRREFDANVGYYLFPTLAVTAGYKQINQNILSGNYVWSGPTIGVSGSAALKGNWAMYGTYGFGFLRLNAPEDDDAGNYRFKANYSLGEFGLAYAFEKRVMRTSLVATVGYRSQIVTTRNYGVSTGHDGYTLVDLHDTTQGAVVGLFGRF